MKSLLNFLKGGKKKTVEEKSNVSNKKQLDENTINLFKSTISNIISEENIDVDSIKKLIKSHDYDTEDIFYNLEFPTSWKDNKKGYSDLKYLIDMMNQNFEDNPKYKNIDWNDFWSYFKANICDLIN